MIGKDELAEAARYADAESEEHGFEGYCKLHGIDPEALTYVAEQRGLRAVMVMRGENPNLVRSTPVALSRQEVELMTMFASSVINGIVIGLTLKERADGDD